LKLEPGTKTDAVWVTAIKVYSVYGSFSYHLHQNP